MSDMSQFNTWVELSAESYRKNIEFFRKKLRKETTLSVVIKANAYGHGIIEIATLAKENNVSTFCVHSPDEAKILRNEGFTEDILVLGPIPLSRMKEPVEYRYSTICYNIENLQKLDQEAAKRRIRASIHLKVETGTNRQGVTRNNLDNFLTALKQCNHVDLDAVYSHFANIEDTTNHDYALSQIRAYEDFIEHIQEAGFSEFKKHFASSAAAVVFDKTHLDMIRLGVSQYGIWPSKETYLTYLMEHGHGEEHILHPVLSWKTRISQIKEIPTGSFIGYGCTYMTTRTSRIAILPIGYSDGYVRLLSNQGYVLIRGKRAPVRGRIAMNLTVVDVTDIPQASLEDEVVLLGGQGDEIIYAEYLASLSNTINYEVVTRIPLHIPRIIIR